MPRKRLFFDIETSPNLGLFWETGYNLTLGPHNILEERKIICIGYKWEGEDEVHGLKWDMQRRTKTMVKKFIAVMDSADEIVAHNGNKFDEPWVRTEAIKNGLDMRPYYVKIDTLLLARKYFNFNSNTLNYITKLLGLGEKIKTDFQMWVDIMVHNNRKVLDDMMSYCAQDVRLLERLYHTLSNYVPASSALSGDLATCQECGAEAMELKQTRNTAAGLERRALRCKECGKHRTVPGAKYDRQQRKKEKENESNS